MFKKILFYYFIAISISYGQYLKDIISKSDVVWNSPSIKSIESMLCGNGDIGINLWAENTGDIYIYIGKTDSWDEYSRLSKVGLIKINITPNPFDKNYYQRLDLFNGQVLFEAGTSKNPLKIKVWVDANNPVINIEYNSNTPYHYTIQPIIWRKEKREIKGEEKHSLYGFINSKRQLFIYPDSTINDNGNLFVYHRNTYSIWKEVLIRQGMKPWAEINEDPLLNKSFGYYIQGNFNSNSIYECSNKKGEFKIYVLTKNCQNTNEWMNAIKKIAKIYSVSNSTSHYNKHKKYWNNFWNKSYLHIYGDSLGVKISKLYNLQRYVFACAGKGKYPIKFNGSIFVVDSCDSLKNYDADYRMWGGPYWNQNTRLIYYPLLYSGDYDLIKPFFDLYINNLQYAKEITKVLYKHDGAFYPETFYFWGSYAMDNFGWNTEINNFKFIENQYIRYHFQGALEVAWMMLNYCSFTNDIIFLKKYVLPFTKEILTFYEKHCSINEKGKLDIYPSQALETYWDIKNPTPDIAAFKAIISNILDYPKSILSNEYYIYFSEFWNKIPELPIGTIDSLKVILPYENGLSKASNSEVPELYPVYPYKIFGINKPDYNIAINTYKKAKNLSGLCWQQGDVLAASLGLTDSAIKYLTQRINSKHAKARFPVFWGNNFDWSPDQDHGGNLMITIQLMLLQYDKDEVYVLPSFPKEWNVDFKLNLPHNKKIIVQYKDKKIKKINLVPFSKKTNIKIF